MKKRHLLKTMLLLFALIVGVGSSWAADTTVSYGWEDSDDATKWTITDIVKTSGQGNTGTYAGKINTNNTYVQFKEKVYVKSFSFAFKRTSNNNNYNVYIETSTDGETWTAAETYAMSSFGNGSYTTKTKTFDGTIEYYVRFHCSNTTAVRYVDDVTITYSNSAANPACAAPTFQPAAGLYSSSQNVTISSETPGAKIYYTMGDNPADPTINSNQYTAPISVSSTTTIKAIAVADGLDNSAVVTANYVLLEHAGTEADPYSVADARAAIDAGTGTQGVYATGIVSEIVTAYNSQYKNISFNISADGTTSADQLEAYRCVGTEAANVAVGDVVVVSGNLIKYGDTYEFGQGCQIVSLTHPTIPSITVDPSTINAHCGASNGTIDVTYNNITEVVADVYSCDADGEAAEYDWITAEINSDNDVEYMIEANEGEARTAYMKVYALDDEENEVYSELITITQAKYVRDYADLPFSFDNGKAAIENTQGLTAEGLGDDYGSSPKLRFDSTDDWMILHFNETPGVLTFDIKGNSFSGGTFKVQTSIDGTTYTDLKTYTELGNTQSEEFDKLAANVRYIKWIYTSKSSGNVAIGNISLAKPDYTPIITVDPTSVAVGQEGGNGEIEVTYKNIDTTVGVEIKWYESDGVTALSEKPVWISSAVINTNTQNIDYQIAENTGDERKAYLKVYALDANANDVYSELITITQAAYVAPFESATYTLASSITSGKHYIIVGVKDDYYAMAEQKPNNRNAVNVTKDNDKITTVQEVTEFVIYGPDADGYYTIFDAKNDGYLYAASSSSNHLKTHTDYTGDARWEITFDNESGAASIVAKGSNTHNVMLYNSGSNLFSCYESASQNPVYLYEKDDEAAPTESVTVSSVSYATYSSENALDFSNTGITVYTAIANGTSVSLTPVSDGIVPAYTGVVLYANGGASPTVPVATSVGNTNWTNNEMVANVKRAKVYLKEGDKTNYILSNEEGTGVGFYLAASGGAYLPANRAYLSTTTTATATGNAPFLGFDGNETTGINSVERGALSVEECYTLDGRRVAQPTKGLYIVNGRKVIIK